MTLLPIADAEKIAVTVIDPYTDSNLDKNTKIRQLLISLDDRFIGLLHQDIIEKVRQEGYTCVIGFGGLSTGSFATIGALGQEIHATSFQ